MMHGQKNIKS